MRLRFRTDTPPDLLARRLCGCGYCARQGARYVSDPEGSVSIDLRDAASMIRYRFATASAEFLSCSRCGIYVAAVSRIGGRDYAVVNANVLDLPPAGAVPKDFDGETTDERLERRAQTWTPVASPVETEASPPIRWSLHLASPPAQVHTALRGLLACCTDVEDLPPVRLAVRCPDGAALTFHVEGDGRGGSDLRFVARGVRKDLWLAEYTSWVAELLALKAAVDFQIDLRSSAPERTQANRYVDGVC